MRSVSKAVLLTGLKRATGLSDDTDLSSPHIPVKGQPSLTGALQPAEWLPLAFYDPAHTQHNDWAMGNLHHWITKVRPHVDPATSTVLAGPLGVRMLAFALSRVLQNLTRLSRGDDVPRSILKFTRGPNRTWSHSETLRLVNKCIDTLRQDIAKSRNILGISYPNRSSKWEEMVRMAAEQHLQRGTAKRGNKGDRGPSATSGVPNGIELLLDMLDALSERSQERIEMDPEQEASIILAERRDLTRRETREVENEQSAEYIDIFQGNDGDTGEHYV